MEEVEEYSSTGFPSSQTNDNEKEPTSEIVTISIDDYRIEESLMKKHVVYIISGQDSMGLFNTSRRYKEFQILRISLLMNWPACYIPKLPKKKATGNLSKDLIHKRKKLLEYFVSKVVSYEFLYKSDAFQMFIRGSPDFIKSSQSLKCLTFIEMDENFRSTFPETQSYEISQASTEEISSFLACLTETLQRVRAFKKTAKKNVISYFRYEEGLCNLSGGFNKVINYFYPTKDSGPELAKKSLNPYKVLLDWARREIIEIESVIESIEKREYLQSLLLKAQGKLTKQQHGLENIQSGKKSLMQRLTKKSNEQQIKDLESQITGSEKEMAALQDVLRIATARLIMFQVPKFKEKVAEKLEGSIRSYSGMIIDEFNDLIAHFTNLQDSVISAELIE